MKDITMESNELNNKNLENDKMPSIKDFASAKITNSFNFIGTKFGQGTKLIALKKNLLSTEAELNNTLAKKIGQYIIQETLNKNVNNISNIPNEFIKQIIILNSEIIDLKEQIKNI